MEYNISVRDKENRSTIQTVVCFSRELNIFRKGAENVIRVDIRSYDFFSFFQELSAREDRFLGQLTRAVFHSFRSRRYKTTSRSVSGQRGQLRKLYGETRGGQLEDC